MFCMALFCSYLIQRPFEFMYENMIFYTSSMLLSSYGDTFISSLVVVGLFMKLMASFPGKIIFTGTSIVVQSFILRSQSLELEDISEMRLLRPVEKLHPKYLFKAKFGLICCFLDTFMWRSSLLIVMKSGDTFMFNLKDASGVKQLIDKEVRGIKTIETVDNVTQAA